jgi:hypothetical protein
MPNKGHLVIYINIRDRNSPLENTVWPFNSLFKKIWRDPPPTSFVKRSTPTYLISPNSQQTLIIENYFHRRWPQQVNQRPTVAAPGKEFKEFSFFPKLAQELHRIIWAFAAAPNTLHISPELRPCNNADCNRAHVKLFFNCRGDRKESDTVTSLLEVCHESRDEALKRLPVGFPSHSGLIPFDPIYTEIAFKAFESTKLSNTSHATVTVLGSSAVFEMSPWI